MATLYKKLAVERICAPPVHCDRLETGRCLATSDTRKFWIQENDFGYPGNSEPEGYLFATYAGTLNKQRCGLFVQC